MLILTDRQIQHKIIRLAHEIVEQNTQAKKVYLAGINNSGYAFASILLDQLVDINVPQPSFELVRLTLNPANPVSQEIQLDCDTKSLRGKTVIIVDDVANTGRTLFYAFKPLMDLLVKKVQVAVLVDRKHKSFPVHVNFVGLSLATTVEEDIQVSLTKKGSYFAKIA